MKTVTLEEFTELAKNDEELQEKIKNSIGILGGSSSLLNYPGSLQKQVMN